MEFNGMKFGPAEYNAYAYEQAVNFNRSAELITSDYIETLLESLSEQSNGTTNVDSIDVELVAYAMRTAFLCAARLVEIDEKFRVDLGKVVVEQLSTGEVTDHTILTMEALVRNKDRFSRNEQAVMGVNYVLNSQTDLTDADAILGFYAELCRRLDDLRIIPD